MTNPGTAAPAGQTEQADLVRERADFGTPDHYREEISQVLRGAEIYASIGQRYTEVADDAGLEHSIRCLVAHTRVAVNLLRHLHELKETQAQRRAERSGG